MRSWAWAQEDSHGTQYPKGSVTGDLLLDCTNEYLKHIKNKVLLSTDITAPPCLHSYRTVGLVCILTGSVQESL